MITSMDALKKKIQNKANSKSTLILVYFVVFFSLVLLLALFLLYLLGL